MQKIYHRPFYKRWILSLFLLILSAVGMLSIIFLENTTGVNHWSILLKSAFEGAFIGGLCDWFAVWKTYQSIEKYKNSVADEIGRWVSQDLISHEAIKNQLSKILDSKDVRDDLIRIFDETFQNEGDVRVFTDKIWDRFEDSFITYISEYTFLPGEIDLIRKTSEQKQILYFVKKLIGDTLIKLSNTKEFSEAMNTLLQEFPGWASWIIPKIVNFPSVLENYGQKLKNHDNPEMTGEESIVGKFIQLFALSTDKYILSWNELPKEERKKAVHSLFLYMKDLSGHIVSRFLFMQKDVLRNVDMLRDYPPIQLAVEITESRIDKQLSQYVGHRIADNLKSLETKDFRRKLENKTRNKLENIRINGTVLGLVIGGLIGLIKI